MFFDDDDDDDRRVVYVEQGGSSVKALLLGALIGAGLALLYAPQSGEETRRGLKRRLRKVRAMAEEKVDELGERFSGRRNANPAEEIPPAGGMALDDADGMEDEDDVAPEVVAPPHRGGAREELERRLEQARARRRGTPAEEPRA